MAQYDCVKFFFGRFQPPHTGHFNIIEQTARDFPNCRIFVFVSPKTSQDDLKRGTYGAYEAEDRYPLTAHERMTIIERELSERNILNVEVMSDARTAQQAIKKIIQMTDREPEDISIVLGEDERKPFTESFRGKPRTETENDKQSHPEKYVGMEFFNRSADDVSATKIRNRLVELIISSNLDTEEVLHDIENDNYLNDMLPRDYQSRQLIIENYKRKIKYLSGKQPFGRYSFLGLGEHKKRSKRSKRRQRKRTNKRSRKKKRKYKTKCR
jgi:cytidyltransferase-like protein